MNYSLIRTFSTGEWSEYVVERFGARYYLAHKRRITGADNWRVLILRAQALALDSVSGCRTLADRRSKEGATFRKTVTA